MSPKRFSRNTGKLIEGGWRSSLEKSIGEDLKARGITFGYESLVVPFEPLKKISRYTPDFILPNGVVVEAKGYFLASDRQKHKAIKGQYPDLDIRFLFSRPRNRLGKASQTTYADWCEQYGFQWAEGKTIPFSWTQLPVNEKSLAIINFLSKTKE